MGTFVLTRTDYPDALERRMGARPAHLDYLKDHSAMVKLAGALLSETGEMAGSMFIIEAESAAVVAAFAENDHYALAHVFERTEIRAFRITVGVIT